MEVLGIEYASFSDVDRGAIVRHYPRTPHFKEDIIQAFYHGIRHKPATTFGNVKADVLADKDAKFVRGNFCEVIRTSSWRSRSGSLRKNERPGMIPASRFADGVVYALTDSAAAALRSAAVCPSSAAKRSVVNASMKSPTWTSLKLPRSIPHSTP